MSKLRVLITGASGFLGGHLCEDLADRHEIVAMVRGCSDATLLKKLGTEVRVGDLTDRESLVRAVKGVDAVVHLAAYYTFTGDSGMYEKVNVQGTRDLLAAMEEQGVDRLLYCSSTEAVGPTGPDPADESVEPRPVYDYGRSKLRAEELVRKSEDQGISSTILRPSGVYGPRNTEDVSYWFITSLAGPLLGRFVFGDGQRLLQFVHVADVVQGFRLALEGPQACCGKTYFITDARAYTYDEIFSIMARAFGRRPPRLHLPIPLAKAMVAPVEAVDRMRGKDNFLWRRSTLDTFTVDRNYSIARAREDLGYSPEHPLDKGLAETVEWYRRNGYL